MWACVAFKEVQFHSNPLPPRAKSVHNVTNPTIQLLGKGKVLFYHVASRKLNTRRSKFPGYLNVKLNVNNAKKSFGNVQCSVFIINESMPVAPVFLEVGVCTINTDSD